MKLTFEVLNLPDMDMVKGAELQEDLRLALINQLGYNGYKWGSGYSVWGFHDD